MPGQCSQAPSRNHGLMRGALEAEADGVEEVETRPTPSACWPLHAREDVCRLKLVGQARA